MLFQNWGISVRSPPRPSILPDPGLPILWSSSLWSDNDPWPGVIAGMASASPWRELSEDQVTSALHLPPQVHPARAWPSEALRCWRAGRASQEGCSRRWLPHTHPIRNQTQRQGCPWGLRDLCPLTVHSEPSDPGLHPPSPLAMEQQAQGEPSNFPDLVGLGKTI